MDPFPTPSWTSRPKEAVERGARGRFVVRARTQGCADGLPVCGRQASCFLQRHVRCAAPIQNYRVAAAADPQPPGKNSFRYRPAENGDFGCAEIAGNHCDVGNIDCMRVNTAEIAFIE